MLPYPNQSVDIFHFGGKYYRTFSSKKEAEHFLDDTKTYSYKVYNGWDVVERGIVHQGDFIVIPNIELKGGTYEKKAEIDV